MSKREKPWKPWTQKLWTIEVRDGKWTGFVFNYKYKDRFPGEAGQPLLFGTRFFAEEWLSENKRKAKAQPGSVEARLRYKVVGVTVTMKWRRAASPG